LRWLTVALLGFAAATLLLEDLPRGRPATLFAALAVFGAALLVVPRWMRDRGAP
jgi:hypothetical protein